MDGKKATISGLLKNTQKQAQTREATHIVLQVEMGRKTSKEKLGGRLRFYKCQTKGQRLLSVTEKEKRKDELSRKVFFKITLVAMQTPFSFHSFSENGTPLGAMQSWTSLWGPLCIVYREERDGFKQANSYSCSSFSQTYSILSVNSHFSWKYQCHDHVAFPDPLSQLYILQNLNIYCIRKVTPHPSRTILKACASPKV